MIMFSHFDTIHACDRQMGRRTDDQMDEIAVAYGVRAIYAVARKKLHARMKLRNV